MNSEKSSKSQHESPADESRSRKLRKKWELQETIKYCEFVKKNRSTLEFTQKKQKQRIYNRMAEYIGTRTTHQCRSHHQKIIKIYNSIEGFIQSFTQKINSARTFMEWSQAELEGIESLRKLEKAKKLDQQLQIKCPIKQESPENQNQLVPKLKVNQVPTIQLKAQFSSFNPCKYQYPPDQPPYCCSLMTYPKPETLNVDEDGQNEGILINESQSHHRHNQFSDFDVPYYLNGRFRDNNKDHMIPKHRFSAWNDFQQNYEFPQYSQIHHYSRKIEKPYQQHQGRQVMQIYKPDANRVHNTSNQRLSYQKMTNQRFHNKHFPTYEQLKQKPQQMIRNAELICSSIMHKQNLNVIGPLVRENKIELTKDKITIHGKQQKEFKYWVECMKVEEQPSQVSEYQNSDSEEINRQLIEELVGNALKKLIKIPQIMNYSHRNPYYDLKPQFNPYYQKPKQPIKAVQINCEFKQFFQPYPYHETPEKQPKSNYRPVDYMEQREIQLENLKEINPYPKREKDVKEKTQFYPQFVRRQDLKQTNNRGNMRYIKTQELNNPIIAYPTHIQSNTNPNIDFLYPTQINSYNPNIGPQYKFNPFEHRKFPSMKSKTDSAGSYHLNPQYVSQPPKPIVNKPAEMDQFDKMLDEKLSVYNRPTGQGYIETNIKKDL